MERYFINLLTPNTQNNFFLSCTQGPGKEKMSHLVIIDNTKMGTDAHNCYLQTPQRENKKHNILTLPVLMSVISGLPADDLNGRHVRRNPYKYL